MFPALRLNRPQIANVSCEETFQLTGRPMRYIPSTVTIVATTLTLVAVSAALIVQSNAETIGSSYTSTAPKDCHVQKRRQWRR